MAIISAMIEAALGRPRRATPARRPPPARTENGTRVLASTSGFIIASLGNFETAPPVETLPVGEACHEIRIKAAFRAVLLRAAEANDRASWTKGMNDRALLTNIRTPTATAEELSLSFITLRPSSQGVHFNISMRAAIARKNARMRLLRSLIAACDRARESVSTLTRFGN